MSANAYITALLALAVAVALHGIVVVIRLVLVKIFSAPGRTNSKVRTLISLAASTTEFLIYFIALGYALSGFGVSVATYLASASILGLAIAFGSQGLVQDVVTGLTILVADIVNVGDMLEVSGQVGIVENFGMRFTVLRNASGALVYIPNRNIVAVAKYPRRHIRCHVDVALPEDQEVAERTVKLVEDSAKAFASQFPAIFLRPLSIARVEIKDPARHILRITFRIWPGRSGPIESSFRQQLIHQVKAINEEFADWMVSVNTEIEVRNVPSDPLTKARELLKLSG